MGLTKVEIRKKAESLRKKGLSFSRIESELGVARSTLSGWLRDFPLTTKEQARLYKNQNAGRAFSRQKASERHSEMKEERNNIVYKKVEEEYPTPFLRNPQGLEIALAMLYLGEGSKTKSGFGLGNSDPMVMKFYVDAIQSLYKIPFSSLRAELHLRADQNEDKMKKFWSEEIGVPLDRFKYVIKDKRTVGKPTYPGYNGVCYVGGGGVEFQRRLMYLAKVLCERIKNGRG
jgi:transcriptional regulator with XRE-family HTH domain